MNSRSVGIYFIVVVCVGMIFLVSTNAIAAEKQIVTVNIQEVLLGSSAGQSVKGVLEGKVAEFQQKFQSEQEAVDAMRAEIEKKSSVWSQPVKE